MDMLKMFQASDVINMLSGNYMDVISKYFTVVAIPVLVIALINCYFGHKVFKVLVGIVGIFIGAGAGVGISIGVGLLLKREMPGISVILIAGILGALIFGFASFKLYKAGAFCMGAISGIVLGVAIMKLFHQNEYIIAAVIGGLLMGLLAIDLYKHMVIILTSVNGGLIGAACISIIASEDDPVFLLKIGIVLALTGIIVQYIILALSKRKDTEDEDEKDEEETEVPLEIVKKQKVNPKKVQSSKTKENEKENKKEIKKAEQKQEQKATKKAEKTAAKQIEKNAEKKTAKQAEKKTDDEEENNAAFGLFLVDFITNIAQFIKDKITAYLNADDVEDEEDVEEFEDEEDIDFEEYDILAVSETIDEESLDYDEEEMKQKYLQSNRNDDKDVKPDVKLVKKVEKESLHTMDVDDFVNEIGHKLEEELDYNLNLEREEELEDLIIKQTIRNIDIG